MSFTHYSQKMRAKGDSVLRHKQFDKAVKGDGDNTMLIWLGKTRLGQRENNEPTESHQDKENLNLALKAIHDLQSSARSKAESNSNNESKS